LGLIRVGDKLINREKIRNIVDEILLLRSHGHSQQDVASRLGIDRTFISRLESIGEVRKGKTMALIGFPLANKEEIETVAYELGVDFVLLMTEQERWAFVEKRSGLELFNDIMALIARIRSYDVVILLGSDKRIRILKALLNGEVVSLELGTSPLQNDVYVDPQVVRKLICDLRGDA